MVQTLITIEELKTWRKSKEAVAFVPTMGALHEGHLSLVKHARELADQVLVSIFVNPKQFGPKEDFSKYPRTLTKDLESLGDLADAVFVPNAATIYPDNFQTVVQNPKLSQILCGKTRPHHFEGVLTVVMKLLQLTNPTHALFGKKDYQQFCLIETMVRDLCLNIEIHPGDTVRESDGLALSSRNQYLSDEEREKACAIYRGLKQIETSANAGETNLKRLVQEFKNVLAEVEGAEIEYIEIREQKTLNEYENQIGSDSVALAAVNFGETRLIDNLELTISGGQD